MRSGNLSLMKMLHLPLLARQEKSSSMAHYHSGTELRKYSFADPPLLAECILLLG